MVLKKSNCFYPSLFNQRTRKRDGERNIKIKITARLVNKNGIFEENLVKSKTSERKLNKAYSIKNQYLYENSDSKKLDLSKSFFNQCFDKRRLKNFVLWFLLNYGENKTVILVEQLKDIGFYYASKAGISLGIEDLKIPPKKTNLIYEAEKLTSATITQYLRGEITGVERFQRLIDTWHRTSEILKQDVIDNFEATDTLNPVYMMAFSGARGNISQVRQLVGMRGLMADPQGQILDFPIRSNFREGLTVTEYIISSYGARKGIVDTALRTANAGYLTRRLVDVAQHVIISNFDCGTKRGIFLTNMKEGNKTINSLSQRLVGRILARDLYVRSGSNEKDVEDNQNPSKNVKIKLASRNEEITADLAFKISNNFEKVFVRSSLTCEKLICQLCYGWSLAQGRLVSIGEAVGVVAAQSIGEPGTQLTMRTFHTGGVFSGDISDQIKAPYDGIIEYLSAIPGTLIRTIEGKIAFLTKSEGSFIVYKLNKDKGYLGHEMSVNLNSLENKELKDLLKNTTDKKQYKIPPYTLIYMRNGQNVYEKDVLAQITTISQKTNATDYAELTMKSDLEGQFYSKSLLFREKTVGPKLKKLIKSPKNSNKFFNNLEHDTFYESWGWGYAWVLSGKIYELKKPTHLFPMIGDLLNTKSYVSQIKWDLNNTGLRRNLEQNALKKSSSFVYINANNIFFEYNKRTPTNSYLNLFSSFSENNKHFKNQVTQNLRSNPIKVSQGLFLDLKNIWYKKYGYTLELSNKSQFISYSLLKNRDRNEEKNVSFLEMNSQKQNINKEEKSDLLFFIKIPAINYLENNKTKDIFSYNKTNNFNKTNKNKLFSLNNKAPLKVLKKNSYTQKSLQKFPYFLQWFPHLYNTKTAGIAVFENVKINNFMNSSFMDVRNRKVTKKEQTKPLNRQINTLNSKNLSFKKSSKRFIEERLNFLKNRDIENSKILWIPSSFFKFSNILTSSNLSQKNTNYNLLPSFTLETQNNLKNIISVFLNKKTLFLQTNNQGNYVFTFKDFSNKTSLGAVGRPAISPKRHLESLGPLNSQLLIENRPIGAAFSDSDMQKNTLQDKNLYKVNNKQKNLFFNTNSYSFFIKQPKSIPTTLIKLKKSITNKRNIISMSDSPISNLFFKIRSDKQSSISLGTKNKFSSLIGCFTSKSESGGKDLNIFKYFTSFKSFLNLIEFFNDLDSFDNNNSTNSAVRNNLIVNNFSVLKQNSLNLNFLFSKLMLQNNINKQNALNMSRSLFLFKLISNINPYLNFRLSNFVELNYKNFSLIKNKMDFDSFVSNYSFNKKFAFSNNLKNQFNLLKQNYPQNLLGDLHSLRQTNLFNYRIKTQNWLPFDNSISKNKSFFFNTQISFFDNNQNSNLFKTIEQLDNSSISYHANVKKGWICISKNSITNNIFGYFATNTKKVIYPGQTFFDNIYFNKPVLVEPLLLNSIFNIQNISNLSPQNFSNYQACQDNSQNGNSSYSSEKKNHFDYSGTHEISQQQISTKGDKEREREEVHFSPSQRLARFSSQQKLGLKWVKNKKSRFYFSPAPCFDREGLERDIPSVGPSVAGPSSPTLETNDFMYNNPNQFIPNIIPNQKTNDNNKSSNNNNNSNHNSNNNTINNEIKFNNYKQVDYLRAETHGISPQHGISLQSQQINNLSSQNQNKFNNQIFVGFLFQPIEEYHPMSNFELKNYVYNSTKNTWNLSEIQKSIKSSRNLSLKSKIKTSLFKFDKTIHLDKNQNIKQSYPMFFNFSLNKVKNNKSYNLQAAKPFILNESNSSPGVGKMSLLPKDGISPQRHLESIGPRHLSFQKLNKFKKDILINKSFDSLSKKVFYRVKNTNKLLINGMSLRERENQQNAIVNKFKTINQKYTATSSLLFLFTKDNDLRKAIISHPNLFTNKTFFKETDWKFLGLFQNKTFFNKSSILKPKSPKESFSISTNFLVKNYLQQYNYFENNTNKFQSISINNENTSLIMVSKKPLNLAPFFISYKNIANFPLSFNLKSCFKLSYSPISNFDYSLYPSFSNDFKNILNYYLNNALIKPNYNSKSDSISSSNNSSESGFDNNIFNLKDFDLHTKNKKLSFYGNFSSLFKNAFESFCFSFYIAQPFELNIIKAKKTQRSFFVYNPYSFAFLSKINKPIQDFTTQISAQNSKTALPIKNQNSFEFNNNKFSYLSQNQALVPEAHTNFYSPFDGELIYIQTSSGTNPLAILSTENQDLNFIQNNPFLAPSSNSNNPSLLNQSKGEKMPNMSVSYSCMFLTKQNLISYYLPSFKNKQYKKFRDFSNLKNYDNYFIKDTLIKFLTMADIQSFELSNKELINQLTINTLKPQMGLRISKLKAGYPITKQSIFRKSNFTLNKDSIFNNNSKNSFKSVFSKNLQKTYNTVALLGDFYVYGDSVCDFPDENEQTVVQTSGQIIHYNNHKITLRKAQPIFISPKSILHKYDGEFIEPKSPVITLSYQQLKTGDIIQGIPKVEQFFEARTTKRGRLFRDSLPSLLKALFKRYQSKMALDVAVRQSFYKIQQIIVEGVYRVYRSQGVTISDKHLEVIVKQMTSKVRILDGAQTGFFPGEVVDLSFVEKMNSFLIQKVTYEPLVLGITKASLEVDSFLSAASFQQTTRVLSQAAVYRKKDFLKGVKENVMLGNLIPAGTGYLVYLNDL